MKKKNKKIEREEKSEINDIIINTEEFIETSTESFTENFIKMNGKITNINHLEYECDLLEHLSKRVDEYHNEILLQTRKDKLNSL